MPPSHRRDVTETSGPSAKVCDSALANAERKAARVYGEWLRDCEQAGVKGGMSTHPEMLLRREIASALLSAEDQVRRDTVQEAARLLCFWCKEGNPLGKDEQHHLGRGCALQSCGALALYRRWPAYAPGEKP